MGQGMTRSGYFIFISKGKTFESQYEPINVQLHFFKRCIIDGDKLVTMDLERYQMYVPIGDSNFNFKKESIYELSEVSHGAGKEDISGTKNLSHHIYPKEYTLDEFKKVFEKNKNRKKTHSPELLQLIKDINKNDREDLDKRLGRKN